MDWIKVEAVTPRKPEIMRIARILGISPDDAFGKAMRFWLWLDGVCVDGHVDGVALRDVDAILSTTGFAAALGDVGWCTFDDSSERITIPNWERHNGKSAKRRALASTRQQKWRNARVDGHVDARVDGPALPDKIRQDMNLTEVDHGKISWEESLRRTLASASKLTPQSPAERRILAVAGMLSVSTFSEHWLHDAVEATSHSDASNRFGYFRSCLREGAALFGLDFEKLAKQTNVPKQFYKQWEALTNGDNGKP